MVVIVFKQCVVIFEEMNVLYSFTPEQFLRKRVYNAINL